MNETNSLEVEKPFPRCWERAVLSVTVPWYVLILRIIARSGSSMISVNRS